METRTYRSTADKTRIVEKNVFILSLLRDPNSSNSEDASLIVEGINQFGKAFLRKYDYVDSNDTKHHKADIQILEISNIEVAEVKNIFTENLLARKEYYSYSLSISKDEAEMLHENILTEKRNPPEYRKGLHGILGFMQSDAPGRSCLEWAIEHMQMLKECDVSNIRGDLKTFKQCSKHLEGFQPKSYLSCVVL